MELFFFANFLAAGRCYLCGQLRARAFIDDSIKYLLPLEGTFVKPFFIRQPWNVHEPTPPASSSIITITSWAEFWKWLLFIKEMHEAICRFNRWENAYYNVAKIAAFWKSYPDKCNAYLQEYKKEKDGETIFEFDEDLSKEIIDSLILPE